MKSFLEYLLLEGKQDVIQLGYPEVIASIMYELFGNKAFLLAKWFRDYSRVSDDEDWWKMSNRSLAGRTDLVDLVNLYYSTKDSESYKAALKYMGWRDVEDAYDDDYLAEQKKDLREEIKQQVRSKVFFNYYSLVTGVINGTVTDLAPYKNLHFDMAQAKFDKKNIFKETAPLKVYPNGYKWINVGKSCTLIGSLMKNCGSVGLMSMDKDRTVLVLFDKGNKPHVMLTYSPNEKRISSEEGVGSSEVKTNYHDYVIDLAKFLDVTFDVNRTKSTFLKTKYLLRNKANGIKRVGPKSVYDQFFVFETNGQKFYTDGHFVVSAQDLQKLKSFDFKYKGGSFIKNVFNVYNRNELPPDIKFIPIQGF